MDGRDPRTGPHGAHAALPVLPRDGRYAGEDGSGRVRVELDSAARDVVVVLEDGWRSAVGGAGLPGAVLQAFSAATVARLTAWATGPARAHPPPRRVAIRATAGSRSRAWHELSEFRRRLTTLHAATESVGSPGRKVIVTVAAGRLAGVEIDPAWQRIATARELEHHIGHALRGALALIATLPERTLDGYPALRALLADTPFAPDSTEAPR
ncbi:hypothetical protein [Pseudonocardia kunmingensis]|uniref:YbaB/EbfC DNA-binding family protein n=1 Tax=Pseudonocardia kunmingensis TaxID=630975 RepID=A0A543DK29_9PSEU|nr:hypothetical protein [Pseudonocardia kunmingensis]TQM09690.1 hypothetical protein FB558_5457 [Pseudonocardia kunmingensis]